MLALKIANLTPSAHQALTELYDKTKIPRLRTRAQMVLLSAEQAFAEQTSVIQR